MALEEIELYIMEVFPVESGSRYVEMKGDDVTGNHKNNVLRIPISAVTLIRKDIIWSNLFKMHIYLQGEIVLNLKFDSLELLNTAYDLLK